MSKRSNCVHLPEEHFFLLFPISTIYQCFFQQLHGQRINTSILNNSSVKYFHLLVPEAIEKLLHKPNLHKHPLLKNGTSSTLNSLSHLEEVTDTKSA